MQQEPDWLKQLAVPVENGKALPDGSVVFNLPPNPRDVAKDRLTADKNAQDAAEKTFRTMTPEEVAAQGLPTGGVYQVNGLGEVKTIQAAPSASAAAGKGGDRRTKLLTLLEQADRVEQLHRENLAGGLPAAIGGRIPFSPKVEQFNSAASGLAEQGLSAFRVPGSGSQSDTELRQFAEANKPVATDSDLAVQEKIRQLRLRANAELAALEGGEAPPSPLTPTGERQTEISGTSDTFLTPEDQQLQSQLSAAYDSGASYQELQAIASQFNRTLPFASQEELDAGRSQGRKINVEPSGVRSEAGKLIGGVADSPVGAVFIGAANALASGGLDEIAGAIGADPATAQAAKEMLRERYPVSSFAGEVAGQAGQLAVGGVGLRAVGAGAKALAGAEIAQGALYGAGESNDNRLGGLAIGAGGAFVGQQLAQKLLNPAAKQVIERISGETGAPVAEVERAVAEAFEGAARQAPTPAVAVDELAVTPLAPEVQTEVGTVARAAIGSGKSAKEAQEKLAVMAKINPEAKEAAERLGIELSPDILSDDTRLLTVAGLARSQAGSDAEAAWIKTATSAIEKADGNLTAVGASRNLAGVSQDVRTALQSNMDELEAGANTLREEVNAAINVRDRVDATNLQAALGKAINDLGGKDEALQAFSAEEKKLFAMLGTDEVANKPTYARLDRLRNQIGEALFKGKGPWVDTEEAALKRYYGALAKDRLDYVAEVGGADIADKMRVSNDLYSKMYDVRGTMQTLFGKQLENDISNTVRQAITTGATGQGKALRTILANVPEDMQAKTLLTGLMSVAGKGGPNGGFSFTKYAEVYRGLRENSPIYNEIAKTVGPETSQVLQDLYAISKRMARAENAVIKTGKSNQPLINALAAEGLVSSVAKSAGKRAAITSGSSIAGGFVGGPLGAGAAAGAAEALQQAFSSAGKTNLDRLHGVLASEPFKELVEKVGTAEVKPANINKVASDNRFIRYAKTVLGIKTFEGRKNWLEGAITASATTQTRPDEQPTSVIEVR